MCLLKTSYDSFRRVHQSKDEYNYNVIRSNHFGKTVRNVLIESQHLILHY